MKEELLSRIAERKITVGVVGLGYVGLPLAVEKAKAGFRTIGFDVQEEKVKQVNAGHNYIGDVVDAELAQLVSNGMLSATSDFSFIKEVDFVAICVPTPLDIHQEPDISYVENSAKSIAGYLTKGTVVVLESTTYPGTTEELIKPILEKGSGLECGKDFYLGILCNRMNIDLWEVIEAAKTKPFGFTAFYPGPGLGGHCIPLDPYYLTWKAREYGFHTSMIEASMMINDHMPEYTVERCGKILNRHRKALNGSKVLVLGVAYKQDIDDYRESPALRVIEELEKTGASVSFYDPYIPQYKQHGKLHKGETALPAELLQHADLVVVTAAHTNIDYDFVQRHAQAVFDTKNVMKEVKERNNIEVL